MTTSGSSIEAKIYASAAKDPKLDNDALHEILLRTAKMESQDAMMVLECCAQNSALNSPMHVAAILKTTQYSLSESSPKQHFIYQTLLERRNLDPKSVDDIARSALKEPKFNSSEIMTVEAVLSHTKTAKETAAYINDFYAAKLPDNNGHKKDLIALLQKRFYIESSKPLSGKTSQMSDTRGTQSISEFNSGR